MKCVGNWDLFISVMTPVFYARVFVIGPIVVIGVINLILDTSKKKEKD